MEEFLEKIREAYVSWNINELYALCDELDKNTELTEHEITRLRYNLEGNIDAMLEEQSLYW